MKKENHQLQTFLKTKKGILIVIIGIFCVNLFFFSISNYVSFSSIQKRGDASGFSFNLAKQFSYFYYYTGYFPLATLNENLSYSSEDAFEEIQENGQDLIMEYKHWSRLGENARIWAFLPNLILAGSSEYPSIKLFNALVFTLSLIILYSGFWRIKKPIYGLTLVALVNFTPFFIYETYANQNIFALLGSVFFLTIGLNIYVIFNKEKLNKYLLLTILSVAIIGLFSEFRNEISIVLLTLLLMCLLAKHQHFLTKILIVFLSLITFYGTKNIIRNHFNQKFEATAGLVEKAGGHVYNGERISSHRIWHPIFCGLGDFDEKYGFEWDDKVAYRYATPILREKYGMDIHYSNNNYYLDNYYDQDGLYYIKFEDLDEYEIIIKEKVLSQIKKDPLWYISIIAQRIVRTLSITIPIPYIGWLIFYVVYFFVKNRLWSYLNLLIVSLPLSATSIIIYSGKGATYNSVFAYFVILSLLVIYGTFKKQDHRLI